MFVVIPALVEANLTVFRLIGTQFAVICTLVEVSFTAFRLIIAQFEGILTVPRAVATLGRRGGSLRGPRVTAFGPRRAFASAGALGK